MNQTPTQRKQIPRVGIYKITNTINGKVYIGQSRYISERWKAHRTRSRSQNKEYDTHLYCAMRKYGLENFIFEVIEECSIEELSEKELKWILFYHSNEPEYGYNKTTDTSTSAAFQKLNVQKVREIKDALMNSRVLLKDLAKKYGVTGEAITDINQGHSFYDNKADYPLRKTLKELGIKNGTYCICQRCGKEISEGATYCVECSHFFLRKTERPTKEELLYLMQISSSVVEISKMFGVSDNTIRKWCRAYDIPTSIKEVKTGKKKVQVDDKTVCDLYNTGLTRTEVARQLNIHPDTVSVIVKRNGGIVRDAKEISSRKTLMFSMDGELLQTFASAKDAGRYLVSVGKTTTDYSKAGTCIARAARGERFSAYGYKWKYE